jgi:ankyrin repeat protein
MFRKWMYFSLFTILSGLTAAAAESDSAKLYAVIRAGDLAGLKTLLDQGISPNTADDRQITPLMMAAETGSVTTMRILIEHGADINAENAFGSTALIWSASDVQKVRLLVEHGADVNKAGKSGRTALMIAALSRSPLETVRLLIAKGADTSVVDQQGMTALATALWGDDTATIRLLLNAGGDADKADLRGVTPLMIAAGNGNLSAVKLLLAKGAKVNAVSLRDGFGKVKNGVVAAGGFTPLLLAATYGPPEVVQALIDAGADVNAVDMRGMTPLMLAATSDRLDARIVQMLLAHGAKAETKSKAGETVLDWADKYGDTNVFKALRAKPGVHSSALAVPDKLPDLHLAVERSVDILEKTSAKFFVEGGCVSCHAQPAANFAVGAARAKGIRVDESAAAERQKQIVSQFTASGPRVLEGQSGGDATMYFLEALKRTGYAPDGVTDYLAAAIAADQREDGGWHGAGIARTPLSDGDFSRTAMAIRALKTYGTPGRASENGERIELAKQWLLHAKPIVTEDFDMRLAGVVAAGGGDLRKLAEPILARQRLDGGWAQRDEMGSDAYATGMTLWALAEAGVLRPDDDVYQKGVKFLLATQSADGSWRVVSRAAKIQPYFESGFPYDGDQWISQMGTGWAANALALGLK